ncbi:MAG: SDR family NAD(P)-dependent oxidoreductase, partial [Ktedonobacteraceae bacterium]|nr:SDR family NAD(P)-dependent oxidoreductase [Ktedonobacteraceae bacterium]
EEYVGPDDTSIATYPAVTSPFIVVLSARDEQALQRQAKELLHALAGKKWTNRDLIAITYTLQLGREAMDQRLAIPIASIEELQRKLQAFTESGKTPEGAYRGEVKPNREMLSLIADANGFQESLIKLHQAGKIAKLCALWVNGFPFDWSVLYGPDRPYPVSLPTYAFARERYWIAETDIATSESETGTHVSDQVYDEAGRSCIRLKGLSLRAVNEEEIEAETGTLLLEPVYGAQSTKKQPKHSERSFSQRCVVLCCREFTSDYQKAIEDAIPGVDCFTLQSTESGFAARFNGYAKALLEIVQELQRAKPKDTVLVQLVIPHGEGEEDLLFGLKGILQTAGMENPKIVGQVIQVERGESAGELMRKLEESGERSEETLIRYQHGEREVLRFVEIEGGKETAVPVWKSGGVYLITGGAGGLGLLFAKEIAQQAPGVRLVLSGRSVLSREKQQELEAIAALGAEVEYLQADVADRAAVEELLAKIGERYGKLDGILHSAGVLRDSYLFRKRFEELEEVLSPKVKGVVNLDEASRDQELDLFVLFSSTSGAFGNVGQADYAAANGFLDEYAAYRNRLVQEGKRRGRTISINWPLWADGGMQVAPAIAAEMRTERGVIPLSKPQGLVSFYRAFASKRPQVVVVAGEKQRLRDALLRVEDKKPSNRSASSGRRGALKGFSIAECILWDLKEQASEQLKLEREKL